MKLKYLTKLIKPFYITATQVLLCLVLTFPSQKTICQSFTQELTLEEELTEMGNKFVELLNASSEETALELGNQVFKESSANEWTLEFRKDYGSVESGRIRLTIGSEYQTVHVIVKVKKLNVWRNFQLVFDNALPKRSGRVNIVLAARPVTISPGLITEPRVQTELKAYIDELDAEGALSGSLLITKDQKPLIERVFGIANREKNRPVTAETPFNLASGGKMFTAVATLRLVKAGKLNLNDPLNKFLPAYPDQALAKRVTVAHLLSHTSGLGDYWDDAFEQHWDEIKQHADYVPFIAKQPLLSEKTGEGVYSNSNFILLGLIIEEVAGQDYYSHIEETIFKPLAMTHTGFYGKGDEDIIAVGYLDLGGGNAIRSRVGGRGSSAGGVYSTTRDMLKFRNAVLNYKLLSKEMLTLATSEQALLDGGMAYGYGFSLYDSFSGSFGHGGRGPGSASTFDIDESSGLTFITMSSMVNGAYSELLFTLKEVLRREK
ncbi:MAG: beta-lactamase family protein [Roseivirga sp.]|nr:beta-lactamase family protein [Roseivirga sp.]